MCASPLSFIKNGPPPPAVVLLPDALFFTRQIEVIPGSARDDVATSVELALEANAPFPLAQVYYGFYWVPGSPNALAYAAYRRRFTVEQTDAWEGSKFVIPSFVAFLGAAQEPATTLILTSADAVTAVYFGSGKVPTEVLSRVLPPESTEEEAKAVRDELLKKFAGTRRSIELAAPAIPLPSRSDKAVEFVSGEIRSNLDAADLFLADVRDRAELQAIRRAEGRDLVLWRVAVGCFAAFALLAVLELGLVGGNLWLKARQIKMSAQKPAVDHIMTEQALALRIEELSTKRLLPMEMLTILAAKKPADIEFSRATTTGRYTLQVEAQTSSAGEISSFQTALQAEPRCDHVEVRDEQARGNISTFTLIVDFKPEALAPAATTPAT